MNRKLFQDQQQPRSRTNNKGGAQYIDELDKWLEKFELGTSICKSGNLAGSLDVSSKPGSVGLYNAMLQRAPGIERELSRLILDSSTNDSSPDECTLWDWSTDLWSFPSAPIDKNHSWPQSEHNLAGYKEKLVEKRAYGARPRELDESNFTYELQKQLKVGPSCKWPPSPNLLGQHSKWEPNIRREEDYVDIHVRVQRELLLRLINSQNCGQGEIQQQFGSRHSYTGPPSFQPIGEHSIRKPNNIRQEDGAFSNIQRGLYQTPSTSQIYYQGQIQSQFWNKLGFTFINSAKAAFVAENCDLVDGIIKGFNYHFGEVDQLKSQKINGNSCLS